MTKQLSSETVDTVDNGAKTSVENVVENAAKSKVETGTNKHERNRRRSSDFDEEDWQEKGKVIDEGKFVLMRTITKRFILPNKQTPPYQRSDVYSRSERRKRRLAGRRFSNWSSVFPMSVSTPTIWSSSWERCCFIWSETPQRYISISKGIESFLSKLSSKRM